MCVHVFLAAQEPALYLAQCNKWFACFSWALAASNFTAPRCAQRASCSDGSQLTIEAFNNSDVDFGVDEHGGHTRDQTGLYHYPGAVKLDAARTRSQKRTGLVR